MPNKQADLHLTLKDWLKTTFPVLYDKHYIKKDNASIKFVPKNNLINTVTA